MLRDILSLLLYADSTVHEGSSPDCMQSLAVVMIPLSQSRHMTSQATAKPRKEPSTHTHNSKCANVGVLLNPSCLCFALQLSSVTRRHSSLGPSQTATRKEGSRPSSVGQRAPAHRPALSTQAGRNRGLVIADDELCPGAIRPDAPSMAYGRREASADQCHSLGREAVMIQIENLQGALCSISSARPANCSISSVLGRVAVFGTDMWSCVR